MEATAGRQRLTLITSNGSNRLAAFARDVRRGLSANPKHLPCCYFYDGEGSLLFEEICALPEYYLTRAEREILQARAAEIISRFPVPPLLVERMTAGPHKFRDQWNYQHNLAAVRNVIDAHLPSAWDESSRGATLIKPTLRYRLL